jgi:tRNA (mo5U34)-methyltransferase
MPTTRPRKIHWGGVEISITLDRMLAERLKRFPPIRWMRPKTSFPLFRNEEPVLDGVEMMDIEWYQTIDLGDGILTPGFVDHRDQIELYGLPDSLEGMRCLDVATSDGFWAFEMERRGAAEVIAIDLHSWADGDFPLNWRDEFLAARQNEIKGLGFAYAKRALNSNVKRKILSVYELSPERVGSFDFVFMSDLLLHLREPLRALEALWTVTRGDAIIADAYDAELEATGQSGALRIHVGLDVYAGCFWWRPTTSALEWLIRLARFQDPIKVAEFDLETKEGFKVSKVVFKARGTQG